MMRYKQAGGGGLEKPMEAKQTGISEILARFDEFNPYAGGRPAVLRVSGREYLASVRNWPNALSESDKAREVMLTEKRMLGDVEDHVLAAFAEDLNFLSGNKIFSGSGGWIGVQNYAETRNAVEALESRKGMTFADAFREHRKTLDQEGETAKAERLDYLMHYAIGSTRTLNKGVKRLERMVRLGDDYTTDGIAFSKLTEFVSLISPPGTEWRLTGIGHKKTRLRLLAGTPFSETGFGMLVEKGGWKWKGVNVFEPLPADFGNPESLTSPVVVKRDDIKVNWDEWPGMKERLEKLKEKRV